MSSSYSLLIKGVCPRIGDNPQEVDDLYDHMYTNFIEEVDGIDNGIDCIEGTKRYAVIHVHV